MAMNGLYAENAGAIFCPLGLFTDIHVCGAPETSHPTPPASHFALSTKTFFGKKLQPN
jgi:hypothetical protein